MRNRPSSSPFLFYLPETLQPQGQGTHTGLQWDFPRRHSDYPHIQYRSNPGKPAKGRCT